MPMRALVNAIVVASFIVLLYLLYSWVQFTIGGRPWFIYWLGVGLPFVVFIGGVGLG